MASGFTRGRDTRGRAHTAVQACRDCRRPMLWVTMPSGKRNPLDVDPVDEGEDARNVIVVEREDGWRIGVVLHDEELKAEALEQGFTLRSSHHATCPKAEERRRPRERADLA